MIVKTVGVVAVTAVAAVLILLILVTVEVIPNPLVGVFTEPPEYSARYYPRTTLAYGWLTLYPDGGQRDQVVELWELFDEYPEVEDKLEE